MPRHSSKCSWHFLMFYVFLEETSLAHLIMALVKFSKLWSYFLFSDLLRILQTLQVIPLFWAGCCICQVNTVDGQSPEQPVVNDEELLFPLYLQITICKGLRNLSEPRLEFWIQKVLQTSYRSVEHLHTSALFACLSVGGFWWQQCCIFQKKLEMKK